MSDRPDAALSGYEIGPDATVRATATAWELLGAASTAVLVEGVSDQIAVDAVGRVLGRDLAADGVVVMPIGGAHAIARTLRELGDRAPDVSIRGLYDVAEEPEFLRAFGVTRRVDLERLGCLVCIDDLEDELMRAAGRDLVEHVVAAQGEQAAFETMRKQQPWSDRPFEAQFRRFCGARSQRKHRYAAALVAALGPDRLPRPLTAVLAT